MALFRRWTYWRCDLAMAGMGVLVSQVTGYHEITSYRWWVIIGAVVVFGSIRRWEGENL